MNVLEHDQSSLAIRPSDPHALRHLATFVAEVVDASVPHNTAKKDEGAMRTWSAACARLGTPPWRTDHNANSGADPAGHARECFLQVAVLLEVYRSMQPRSRSDRAAGRPAKPDSAMNVIYAVRRAHERRGFTMAKPEHLRKALKGLLNLYKREHGPEYLLPEQKEPLNNGIYHGLLAVADGTVCGSATVDWSALPFIAFRACLALGKSSGARKDEVSLPDGVVFDKSRASRASLRWLVGGSVVPSPTPAQLRALGPGDAAIFIPPPSKADPWGFHFSNRPVWLPFAPGSPGNAAAALRDYELAVPVPAARHRSTPIFCVTTSGQPLRHSRLDTILRDLLTHLLGPDRAKRYSFHSCRIALACELLACGAPPDLIQALVRWRNDESLRRYARLNPRAYMDWVQRASSADASAVNARNLPTIDDSAAVADLDDALNATADRAVTT